MGILLVGILVGIKELNIKRNRNPPGSEEMKTEQTMKLEIRIDDLGNVHPWLVQQNKDGFKNYLWVANKATCEAFLMEKYG